MANDGAALLSSLGSALGSAVSIDRVEIDSQFTPVVTYTPGPDGTATPAGGSGLLAGLNPLKTVKPRAKVYLAGSAVPIIIAPWGEPTGNYLPALGAALAGTVGAVAFYRGAKSFAKGAFWVALGLAAVGYLANQSATTTTDGGS